MTLDPRIRGFCPVGYPLIRVGVPRPSKNPNSEKVLSANFHKGQKVLYCGVERTVHGINHYFIKPTCFNLIGKRIITTIDLGQKDSKVPWYLVKLI